ncbi:MAG: hypothetical protein RJQ07_00880 [Pseudomonadales bacterium]
MYRYYFKSRNLDSLGRLETTLEQSGIARDRIHVVSESTTAESPYLRLNTVADLLKRDMLRRGVMGMLIGAGLVAGLLLVAYFANWFADSTTSALVVIGSVLLFGYCTWQGGYFGIRLMNNEFKQFESDLRAGHHLLFVELDSRQQAPMLQQAVSAFADVESAGQERGRPKWMLHGQRRFNHLLTEQLP